MFGLLLIITSDHRIRIIVITRTVTVAAIRVVTMILPVVMTTDYDDDHECHWSHLH